MRAVQRNGAQIRELASRLSLSAVSTLEAFAHDGAFWRKLAHAGARHGPAFWVRYSPSVFGAAFALALPRARRQVRDTLRWVQGEQPPLRESRAILRTFTSYAHCLAEALAAGRRESEHARLTVLGEDELARALSNGRGAIVVTAHAGPWDAITRALGQRTRAEVVVVMQRERDGDARDFHDAVREGGGVRVVHVGDDPLAGVGLLRHLARGGIVALQLDRGAPSGRSLSVELFQRPFRLPEGPFRLAQLSGAAIVPVFARRVGFFDYEVRVRPALGLPRSADAAARTAAAQATAAELEAFLSEDPTQWFRFDGAEAQMP